MKTFTYLLLSSALLCGSTCFAQQTPKPEKKKETKEKKEIIIEEKKSGKTEKMVIVIDNDNVTINGKPAKEYSGKKRIVIDDDISINGNVVTIPREGRVIVRHGGSSRAVLGVSTSKDDKGAKVNNVVDESAAAKAGLKEGDIITKVNDKKIEDSDDLVNAIRAQKPEDVVNLTYLREGKEKKVKATLGKGSDSFSWNWDKNDFYFEPPMAMTAPRPPRAPRAMTWSHDGDMWMFHSSRPRYGMGIEDYADGDGVRITNIDSAGNAEKAGLKTGDIITEAEGKAVKKLDDLREILDGVEDDKSTISMKVLRNGNTEAITIRIPKQIKKAQL